MASDVVEDLLQLNQSATLISILTLSIKLYLVRSNGVKKPSEGRLESENSLKWSARATKYYLVAQVLYDRVINPQWLNGWCV